MADKLPRKRKFYGLALDPNYQSGMTTDRTGKVWEDKYKESLDQLQLLQTDESEAKIREEYGEQVLITPGESVGENLLDCSSSDEDSSDERGDDYEDQHLKNTDSILRMSAEVNAEPSASTSRNPKFENRFSYLENSQKIMFEKSGQTVSDVMEMIVAYCLRFGDSNEARNNLIDMFKICAGPDFKDLNISNYKLAQVINLPSDTIVFHFYCDKCTKKVSRSWSKKDIKGQSLMCEVCEAQHCLKLENSNNFISIDLEYQLRTLLEKEELAQYFFDQCQKDKEIIGTDSIVMRDIHDSVLYKETIRKHSITITYIISTDGAPLFHVSKRGFWPLQVLLNNLPLNLRFKFVLLVGIMVVRTEPKPDLMNLFINEFSKQANHLHYEGLTFKFPNQSREMTIHFTPIFVVADSVARPILQNRLQFNGYSGCSYCYHGGQHVKDNGLKYPFLEKTPKLRTHESHLLDVADSKERGSFVRGVKGASAFMDVPNIDMVWGFPLDYLHNALFGVTEQVLVSLNKYEVRQRIGKHGYFFSAFQYVTDSFQAISWSISLYL